MEWRSWGAETGLRTVPLDVLSDMIRTILVALLESWLTRKEIEEVNNMQTGIRTLRTASIRTPSATCIRTTTCMLRTNASNDTFIPFNFKARIEIFMYLCGDHLIRLLDKQMRSTNYVKSIILTLDRNASDSFLMPESSLSSIWILGDLVELREKRYRRNARVSTRRGSPDLSDFTPEDDQKDTQVRTHFLSRTIHCNASHVAVSHDNVSIRAREQWAYFEYALSAIHILSNSTMRHD
jgi:hypothetical protein